MGRTGRRARTTPETHLLYVCASDRISNFTAREKLEDPTPNMPYMGGAFGQAQIADVGILAALDVTTNRLVWRRQWREICFSGSVVTAGGLLFVGRADGRLTALDKSNGNSLWEFVTDAGVNTTVTTFEHKGRQHVVVHAGGGLFANGKRGDGVWMFSLDGKIPSLPAAAAARGNGGGPGGGGKPASGPSGDHEVRQSRQWRDDLQSSLCALSWRDGVKAVKAAERRWSTA